MSSNLQLDSPTARICTTVDNTVLQTIPTRVRKTYLILKFFSTPEGYVEQTFRSFNYIYQYQDHLGNVRLSYKDNNGTLEIIEENNYYPFGLKHKGYNTNITSTNIALKRKFGGKEYQDELGLDWYDITARNYDPALGRWMNIDPLAEMMRRHSPYNYAFNNPIFFIDYDGMMPSGINCDNCDNSITYSYQNNGSEDIHTLTTIETTANDSFSNDGNTKTTTTYTTTTTDTTVNNKQNGLSKSTSQSVDKTTETFSKDSDGNWVANGEASKENIAQNNSGLVHEEGAENTVKTGQNGIIDGDNYIPTSRSSTNQVINDRLDTFLNDSNIGDNLIDNPVILEKIKTGSTIYSGIVGGGALALKALKYTGRLVSAAAKSAAIIGGAASAIEVYQLATETPLKTVELARY